MTVAFLFLKTGRIIMKNDTEKNRKSTNPLLKKFESTVNSRFEKDAKSLKDFNKKIDYSFTISDKR